MAIPHPAPNPDLAGTHARPTAMAVDGAALHCAPRRILACLIDSVCVLVPVWACFGVTGQITGEGPTLTFNPGWWGLVALWVVGIAYFGVCEARWGATPAKRLLRLRAVNADGSPLSGRAAFVRNALRVVDQFLCPVVGPTAMLSDPDRRRIGDVAARTRVVRVTPAAVPSRPAAPSPAATPPGTAWPAPPPRPPSPPPAPGLPGRPMSGPW